MGGYVSTSVTAIDDTSALNTDVRIPMLALYRKPSFFSNKGPKAPYPGNMTFRQRIKESEWNDYVSCLQNSLQDSESPDILMCVIILALSAMSIFVEYGFVVLIISCFALAWYHSYRRRCWMNMVYYVLANYNKYLFRPRGIQLRLQVKCGHRPISTSSVRLEEMSLKLEIAHTANRSSLASQFPPFRMESRRTLRCKSADGSEIGYIDFYEKKMPSSIRCFPPLDALLDESKFEDNSLRMKYQSAVTPRRGSHSGIPVVTATQVTESPAPVGSPVYMAYPYTGVLTAYGQVDDSDCVDQDRYGALLVTGYAGVVVPPVVNPTRGMLTLTLPQVIENELGTPTALSTSARSTDDAGTAPVSPINNFTTPINRPSRRNVTSLSPDMHVTRAGSWIGSRSISAVVPYSEDRRIGDHMNHMDVVEIV